MNDLFLMCLGMFSGVLAVGLLGAGILRKHPARAHTVLVCSCIGAVLTCAVMAAGDLRARSSMVAAAENPNPAWQPLPGRPLDPLMADAAVEKPAPAAPLHPAGRRQEYHWSIPAAACWSLLSLAIVLTRLPGIIAGRRLLHNAQPVTHQGLIACLNHTRSMLRVTTDVRLLQTDAVVSPVIWCWLRPVILVPVDFDECPESRWQTVFHHELAHLQRRDHLTSLLSGLMTCLIPWHPLVWVQRQWIRCYSEQACDERVLSRGTPPDEYADTLLQFACRPQPALMNPMGSQPSDTVVRVQRILAWNTGSPQRAGLLRSLCVVILLATAAIAPPLVHHGVAKDPAPLLTQETRDEWITRLTSASENSRWYVGANLGRELSTLPGRWNVEILEACWQDIADSVRPQILKGFMPAFKKTDGVSDGLFDILDLARRDSSRTVRQFSQSYLGSLTLTFDVTDADAYAEWRQTHRDRTATEIILSEISLFASTAADLPRDEVDEAAKQLGDAASHMREFRKMRQAVVDAGLVELMERWVRMGWIAEDNSAFATFKSNLSVAGVEVTDSKAAGTPSSASSAQNPNSPQQEPPGPSVQQLTVDDKGRQQYFLMVPPASQPAPETGWKLLLILPGGDGSADFQPFCRNIHQNALPDGYVAAQLVAPVWSGKSQRVIWPVRKLNPDRADFTTEEFIAAVVDHIQQRLQIDERCIFTLGWSSSGPALYATALERTPSVTGSMIAMSVYKPRFLPSLRRAKDRSFYLLHSPDDFIRIDEHARAAERQLKKSGAQVKLQTYGGGHGWREDPLGHIQRGILWLEQQATAKD